VSLAAVSNVLNVTSLFLSLRRDCLYYGIVTKRTNAKSSPTSREISGKWEREKKIGGGEMSLKL